MKAFPTCDSVQLNTGKEFTDKTCRQNILLEYFLDSVTFTKRLFTENVQLSKSGISSIDLN